MFAPITVWTTKKTSKIFPPTTVQTTKKMKRHFSATLANHPRICPYYDPIRKNPGTFVRIPQKVVAYFLAVRTVVGENILEVFVSCPHGGKGKYFGGVFSCPHGGRGEHFGR